MNIVKTISTSLNNVLQRLIKITRYGNADVQTSQQVSPFGVDSNPVKDTAAAYSTTDVLGKTIVLGYLQKNMKSADGEIRIFSIGGEGEQITQIWLDNAGNIYLEVNKGIKTNNLVRFNEMLTAFSQLQTEVNAAIAVMNANVAIFNSHTHNVVLTPSPITLVPNAAETTGVPSVADMTDAATPKIFTK